MEDFSMNAEYRTGHELIDAQHLKVLVGLSQLYGELLRGKTKEELYGTVENLEALLKLHFFTEEAMLETLGCSGMDEMVAHDAVFLRHLQQVFSDYGENSTTETVDGLLFLKSWFVEHVRHVHKRCVQYANGIERMVGLRLDGTN
ncbi:bacteriohemerythrin [Geomesophilobacter sediminis]|uniref:Hemerythrin family protein n=1 Tax=Geomesophilobacter sediminis TaxID=2798584 RepID=A0A8J7IN47_9BACT|nr:hemerythrin family protein [Geomesophilobacter sediminis]MBJ6724488.1 hemerythrin family protein [Geomesophilobacter sediminis]